MGDNAYFWGLKSKIFIKEIIMRKTFEPQLVLGCTSIGNVQIPTKSRDEFPPFLRAMQYIFLDKELNHQVFNMLKTSICTKQPTGRLGMDLWSIFVLAGARLCLNTDYDRLHYLSNNDNLLRQILGVHDGIIRGREFDMQTIKDNVQLLDDHTLREINHMIVQAGHHLVKQKDGGSLRIKIDSFVTEANVHFPTDYNLLWDSGRKCIDVLGHLMESDAAYCTGWRKLQNWFKKLKNNMLALSRAIADKSKNREERIGKATDKYLFTARSLSGKLSTVKQLNPLDPVEEVMFKQLSYYREMLDKHIDLVERRLVKGETIPHEEKIFSIFEPWVEWICKGKAHKPVELGKRTCIASDQWHFILDWWVADHQQDNAMLLPVIDRIRQYYAKKKISSCSSDKGFFSKIDVQIMEMFEIKVMIPKKGKRSLTDLQKESDPAFIKARHAHSAVESNINELEHRGLDRCPDKGIKGMHRYAGLAVIGYNLRRIGQILIEKDRKEAARKATKHQRAA
jgi:hypothetical protein